MLNVSTNYAKSGGVHIAYQVVGDGPLDLVWIPSLAHHVELNWENPSVARYLTRLAELTRLIVFDKRGTGMSDRICDDATLEIRMDDIRAVLSASRSERAVVCGIGDGGPLAALFAATYPDRTSGLVLVNSTPRFVRSAAFPWLPTRADHEQLIDDMVSGWSDPSTQDELLLSASPDMSAADLQPFGRLLRLSVSPGALAQYLRMNLDVDVSGILASIRVPTLVLHRSAVPTMDVRGGRYLGEHIPGARLVVLDGRNLAPGVGDVEPILDELGRFLETVVLPRPQIADEPERVLATVLFTDIVGSTAQAAAIGDRAWRDRLDGASRPRQKGAAPLPRNRVRHRGRRLLRELRRPCPRDPVRVSDRRGREVVGPRSAGGAAHGRMRARRRQARRNRRPHGRARRRVRRSERGSRLEHRARPRGRG